MKLIFVILAVVIFYNVQAQTNSTAADTSVAGNHPIQIQAKFPGGIYGWQKYLQTHLHAEVGGDNIVLRKHQRDSSQAVVVSFLVDTTGNITEVVVMNPAFVHPKVGEEAVRVIKEGPKWIPATENGKKVIYRQKQTITFQVAQG